MTNEPSVLVVDRTGETREVLEAVLPRRGMRILAAREPQGALALARQQRPDLIVVDVERDPESEGLGTGPLRRQSREQGTPVIILGQIRREGGARPGEEFLAKPYHYRTLFRKIEELLEADSGTDRRPAAA